MILISGHHSLFLDAHIFNINRHYVTGFKIYLWIYSETNARWGAGRYYITRLTAHELTNVTDQIIGFKDHCPGIAILITLTVNLQPHIKIIYVFNLIFCYQPWADWSEGVTTFSLVPLTTANFHLETAFRHIIYNAITSYVVLGVCFIDINTRLAYDNAQFYFPIQLSPVTLNRPGNSGDPLV